MKKVMIGALGVAMAMLLTGAAAANPCAAHNRQETQTVYWGASYPVSDRLASLFELLYGVNTATVTVSSDSSTVYVRLHTEDPSEFSPKARTFIHEAVHSVFPDAEVNLTVS